MSEDCSWWHLCSFCIKTVRHFRTKISTKKSLHKFPEYRYNALLQHSLHKTNLMWLFIVTLRKFFILGIDDHTRSLHTYITSSSMHYLLSFRSMNSASDMSRNCTCGFSNSKENKQPDQCTVTAEVVVQ